MDSTTKLILKIVGVILAVAAIAALIIVFRREIGEFFEKIGDFFKNKLAAFNRPAEYDDFDDLEY